VGTSKKFVMKTVQSTTMSKTNILNFSGQMVKDKAYIPPPGSYNVDKCAKFVYKPGMRKRV
jgi:hypothetical protein